MADTLRISSYTTMLLIAAGGCDRVRERQPDSAIRVMTFNIRYGAADDGENRWEKRRELVFDLLRREKPDLLGVQEALRFQLNEIRAALPVYAEIGVRRDDGRAAGEHSAILYRTSRFRAAEHGTFWLSETPDVPGSMSWGADLSRICTWGRFVERSTGAAVYVYNLHLDHQSQSARLHSVGLLIERIHARSRADPVIVLGDFNAAEDNPAVRRLCEASADAGGTARFVDTFRVLHPDERDVGTFTGFRFSTGAKIDYIFAPQDLPVLDAAILRDLPNGRFPSDHFPVTATLRF